MLQFYRELDLGVEPFGAWPKQRPGNLAFLSARPHVYKDRAEMASFQVFKVQQPATRPYITATNIEAETARAAWIAHNANPSGTLSLSGLGAPVGDRFATTGWVSRLLHATHARVWLLLQLPLPGVNRPPTRRCVCSNMEPVALKKMKNFEEYASCYPEFTFVFVGDNGQGRLRADRVQACCIGLARLSALQAM